MEYSYKLGILEDWLLPDPLGASIGGLLFSSQISAYSEKRVLQSKQVPFLTVSSNIITWRCNSFSICFGVRFSEGFQVIERTICSPWLS
jgi:hypothetical protein